MSGRAMLDVALLGCGRWGMNHLQTLSKLRGLGVINHITVVDPSVDARMAAMLADDVAESLDGIDTEVVIIATPSHLHAQQARDAMKNGCHVFVEKPLGCCETEAAQVLATAVEYGRVISIGLLLRFHPAVKLVKKMLRAGEIGRLEELRFSRETMRETPLNSNVVEALGVHAIDLLCHLMGEVEPSTVNTSGDESQARVILEFPHGIEGIIDLAWDAKKENRTVELIGSKGKIIFDLNIHNSAKLLRDDIEFEIECESNKSPLEAELLHFFNAIKSQKEGGDWIAVPEHGAALRGVRWTERAVRSLHLSRPH